MVDARFTKGKSGGECAGSGMLFGESLKGYHMSGVGSGTAAVYSAPDEDSWRAGKGKAAVGLQGELWKLCSLCGKGGSYAMIRYDVSERTQRIGFVNESELGTKTDADMLDYYASHVIDVGVAARRETFLTDDPDVSQFAQLDIAQGTKLRCKAVCGPFAYVDATGIAGGQTVWGFVPLIDLELDADERKPLDAHSDAMREITGTWVAEDGIDDSLFELTLNADGTFETRSRADAGVCTVTAYEPESNLYWNEPDYELTRVYGDGRAAANGLSVMTDGEGVQWLTLSYWAGSMGYRRKAE